MPADSTPKDSDPQDSDPRDSDPDVTPGDASDETSRDADAAEVPLNRAERRGHARKGSKPHGVNRGKVGGRSSAPPSPRMWTNRRGGS